MIVYSELVSFWYDIFGNFLSYDRFGYYGVYDVLGNWVGGLRNIGFFVNFKFGGYWINQCYEGWIWGLNFGGNLWFFFINNGFQSLVDVIDELCVWVVYFGDLCLVVDVILNGMEIVIVFGLLFFVSGSFVSWNY